VVRRIEARLPERFPDLAGVTLAEAWAGMIDVTPDAVPTLGEQPGLPGLWIATGLSGHGFGIGPAIGRIMADLVTGRDPGHDLTRFRPGRFTDGSEIVPGPY
jgi:glycine/D-amino acid oxidase-like deaminating enzyme